MNEEKDLASVLNELRDEAYESAKGKGFHDEERPDCHWLMLIICEIAEAVEADRCGRHADLKLYEDDLCTGGYPVQAFNSHIKDTVEDELADVCIRILDFMGMQGISVKADEYIWEHPEEYFGQEQEYTLSGLCLQLTSIVVDDYGSFDGLNNVLNIIHAYCILNDIDILRHIRLKMEYNRTRPRLHGKRY